MNKFGKNKQEYRLFCVDCNADVDEFESHTKCVKCEGVLDVEYDYEGVMKTKVKDFGGFLPLKDVKSLVTLKEGNTPLYKAERLGEKYGLKNLYVKNEGANPTGVFKDRGSSLEVTKALEAGARALIIASSGNMAASCTAYASKGGLKIYVLVPEDTPVGKLSQILSYGAHVIKIKGNYSECVEISEQIARNYGLYQVGDYVFRREGQKLLAYELVKQMGDENLDGVVVPTGAGTHIAGLWKGFVECEKLGYLKKLPKMFVVQPDGCAVLVRAFEEKKNVYSRWKKADTICSAVSVTDPVDGNLALNAVYESGGAAVAVSDKEALNAQKDLASMEGVFTEPSSALAIAAIRELKKRKMIKSNDKILCIATGNGLKDPLTPLQNLPVPKTLEADFKVVSRYIKSVHR